MRAVRIRSVAYNNRKKQLTVSYDSGKMITVHYGQVSIGDNLASVRVDQETGQRAIVLEYANGARDYMPWDQPLSAIRDPEFLLQTHIERLTALIRRQLSKKHISLRYLAEQLETSDQQIQRLLNPSILNKNLPQLYRIASLLNLEVELSLKSAA